MSDEVKVSPVEVFKRESNFLAGDIAEELVDGNDFFGKGSIQLLKHHGTYQQDDRDQRGGADGKAFMMMVRSKIPGGELNSEQLLAQLDMCDDLGNNTLRITSRQGLQFHGVYKSDLQEIIQRVNAVQMSTLGACGDVNRNVMCCPAPYKTPIYQQIQRLAHQLADHFAPRSSAYHEIWLKDPETEEKQLVGGGDPNGYDIEPIYGKIYLPRKFKMAIAFPFDNCIDIYTHDLGYLAIVRDDQVVGYNLLVGGGQGVTPAQKKTFPALAKKLCYVDADQVVHVAEAIVKVQRDFGNREDRKNARLKYLIHNWGIEKFKEKVEEYYGQPLAAPEPDDVHAIADHMGWDEQGDGKWFYGLNVENGRIKDEGEYQLKSALREICSTLRPGIRLTANQSIIFTDIAEESKSQLEEILTSHGVPLTEQVSNARRWSMACVAWPTCGLSITESERALPGIIDELDASLAKLGLGEESFTIRMTGCPNGCARPYNCDVGLVGKAKEKYSLFLGGRQLGDRLSFLFMDRVPGNEIVSTLEPLLNWFKAERDAEETFGDFCHRQGKDALLARVESAA